MQLSGKNKFYAAKDQTFWFQHYFSLLSAEFGRDWSLSAQLSAFWRSVRSILLGVFIHNCP